MSSGTVQDPTYAVQACGLTKIFSTKRASITALDSVDMNIPSGSMTALVGPDGAGKTTFLRLACGLFAPTSGSLTVLGRDAVSDPQEIQDRISYMPQRFGLYEDLSVQENLDLYADMHGISPESRQERFARLLEMTGLATFTARPASKLSGGMKQKLALACTLVRSPDLLLLDEPSAGVDPLSRRELWEIVTRMVHDEQITVIVCTAYMDEAERCGTVFVMHEGRVLRQGSPQELKQLTAGRCYITDVPEGTAARQLQAQLLDRRGIVMDAVPEGEGVRMVLAMPPEQAPEDLRPCRAAAPTLESSFIWLLKSCCDHGSGTDAPGTSGLDLPPVYEQADREVVIEVRDLVRRFGNFTAVDKTSFDVRRGEVFGLLGPNGAGKTTTFRMLCGLLPATSGHLRVAGENLRTAPAHARARVGYVSQKFSLYGNLSVIENLRFFGGVYGLGPIALRRRIQEVIGQLGLNGRENDISCDLPGGYKQRLAMAVGLLHKPEILFLDEPTSGIDPLARRMFWRQITMLAEHGTTIVITTHFMEEAEYCDRMLIQDAGKVLALGTPREVRRQGGNAPTMEDAFIRIVEQARAAKIHSQENAA